MKEESKAKRNYLFTRDYQELINKCLDETDKEACYKFYCETYLPDNKDFEEKFFEHLHNMRGQEIDDFVIHNLVDDDQIQEAEKWSGDQFYRKMKVWSLRNSKLIPYTNLHYELLPLKKSFSPEDLPGKEFTTKEIFFLLDKLGVRISNQNKLKVILPLITGLNGETIKSNLKDFHSWFTPKKTPDNALQYRIESLKKIQKELTGKDCEQLRYDIEEKIIEFETEIRNREKKKL